MKYEKLQDEVQELMGVSTRINGMKIADMPFLSITHYQSLEKSVSIQSLIH